ncbi:MAG TPA: septum formation family protein [Acidimicrobiales bacterium]|nr:septum formation family protein [Acidimicrobiales bacterium]
MADDDAKARRTTKATAAKAAKKATAKRSGAAARVQPAVTRKAQPKKAVAETPVTKKRAAAPAKRAATAEQAAPAKRAVSGRKAGTAKKVPPVKNAGAVLAPRQKQPPPLRLAAEQTFDDDWEAPVAEPVREDPHARIRSVLRAAAMSLESRDAPVAQAPPPRPAPPAPTAPRPTDEPVTRVLVAPVPVEDDEPETGEEPEIEDEWQIEEEEDREQEDEDADWAPPEVLDDDTVVIASAPPPRTTTPEPAPTTVLPEPTAPSRAPLPPTGVISAPTPAAAPAPEKKPRRGLRRLVLAILVIALVAVAAVVAYSLLRDEGVDYSKLEVGDCFDSSSNEVRGIKVEPCSEPHNSEIFFLVTHPAGRDEPYPGKDVLVQFAADACLGQPFTDYVGIPLEQSKLKDFEIVPQDSAWNKGRRVLVCGIDTGGEGDITGSVKGTRR